MSQGITGIVRSADVSPNDIEAFLYYTPTRNVETPIFKKIDANDILTPLIDPTSTTNEILGGLYNLRLPISEFSSKGYYTLYLRPKQIRTKIIDANVLSSLPNVRGLVFDLNSIPTDSLSKFENNNLIGYRVEYLDNNKQKINNLFKIVTSNNRCEPVNQNLTNTNQKAIRYRFNDNSSLVFCTVSPSSNSVVKPNVLPFIGNPNQDVIISNTFFNPVAIEIEMVEHDFETLAYALYGNQAKSVDDGVYSIFNFNNEVYKQYDLFEIRNDINDKPLFEVRKIKDTLSNGRTFNEIIGL